MRTPFTRQILPPVESFSKDFTPKIILRMFSFPTFFCYGKTCAGAAGMLWYEPGRSVGPISQKRQHPSQVVHQTYVQYKVLKTAIQWSSHLSGHGCHMKGCGNQGAGPWPRGSQSAGLGPGLRICICNRLLDSVGWKTTVQNAVLWEAGSMIPILQVWRLKWRQPESLVVSTVGRWQNQHVVSEMSQCSFHLRLHCHLKVSLSTTPSSHPDWLYLPRFVLAYESKQEPEWVRVYLHFQIYRRGQQNVPAFGPGHEEGSSGRKGGVCFRNWFSLF